MPDTNDLHKDSIVSEPVASPQATTEEREFCFDRYVTSKLGDSLEGVVRSPGGDEMKSYKMLALFAGVALIALGADAIYISEELKKDGIMQLMQGKVYTYLQGLPVVFNGKSLWRNVWTGCGRDLYHN